MAYFGRKKKQRNRCRDWMRVLHWLKWVGLIWMRLTKRQRLLVRPICPQHMYLYFSIQSKTTKEIDSIPIHVISITILFNILSSNYNKKYITTNRVKHTQAKYEIQLIFGINCEKEIKCILFQF